MATLLEQLHALAVANYPRFYETVLYKTDAEVEGFQVEGLRELAEATYAYLATINESQYDETIGADIDGAMEMANEDVDTCAMEDLMWTLGCIVRYLSNPRLTDPEYTDNRPVPERTYGILNAFVKQTMWGMTMWEEKWAVNDDTRMYVAVRKINDTSPGNGWDARHVLHVLTDYFDGNAEMAAAYIRDAKQTAAINGTQTAWLLHSEADHKYLANSAAWMDARVQLNDAADNIQKAWHTARNDPRMALCRRILMDDFATLNTN